MSLRAKIIFGCLLLALFSVPLVYTLLTWHPEQPLRFRATALREQHYRSQGHVDFQVYEIEVENTSGVPIHIVHGEVGLVMPSAFGPIPSGVAGFLGKDDGTPFAGRTLSHAILEEVIIVPAYGKVRCIAGIYHDATSIMRAGQVHIGYEWKSGTKQVAMGITSWVQAHLLGSHTTTPPSFPTTDRDTSPVDAEGLHLPASRTSTPAS
jgi:hypothetical protein